MFNLDYPISILQAERERISLLLVSTGVGQLQRGIEFNEVNKAIKILIAEKMKDELGIIPEKKAKKLLTENFDKE